MTTREDRIKMCKTCRNVKHDFSLGLVCGLTNKTADFEEKCDVFVGENEPIVKIEKLKSDPALEEPETDLEPASGGKRFTNYLLDTLFIYVSAFILGFVIAIISIYLSSDLSYIDEDNSIMDYFYGFCIYMVYYTLLEATTGRTIAKYITRTKVVTEDGRKPGFNTILLRSLCRFIPFEPFSFLGSNSGWHDSLSKTEVVNIKTVVKEN
jgi:uncharacterized RDD family membrane protein YckC